MTKELRITLRARNNRLIAARESLGLGAREAAARVPVSYPVLLKLEGLKISPLDNKGVWRGSAVRVAAYYGSSPEYFWPEVVMALVEPEKTVEIDAMDVAVLSSGAGSLLALPDSSDPEADLIRAIDSRRLHDLLTTLPEREAQVLSLRFGLEDGVERTLDEVGAVMGASGMGASRERMRQLQASGLAKIRTQIKKTP